MYFKQVCDSIAFDDIDDIIQDNASNNSYNNENIDPMIIIGHNKYDNKKMMSILVMSDDCSGNSTNPIVLGPGNELG